MPPQNLPDDQKNLALRPSAVHRILSKLEKRGISSRCGYSESFTGRPIREQVGEHFQGVARCVGPAAEEPGHFFATTNAGGGLLLHGHFGDGRRGKREIDNAEPVATGDWCRSTMSKNSGFHPGGIQSIGRCVVVPVYPNARPSCSEIQVWSDTLEQNCVFRITDRHAFAAGITNIGATGYLLAVVVADDGKAIRFYWTNDPLEGRVCVRPIGTVTPTTGYPNGISLLADTDGNAYLIGLYSRGFGGYGPDYADLYGVGGVGANGPDPHSRLTVAKIGKSCNLECDPGGPEPAFRWGASARVISETDIEIVAIGMENYGQQRPHSRPIFAMNVFENRKERRTLNAKA